MLGRYRTGGESKPFLILKTDSFENTFSSMLLWEETMQNDLAPYFGTALQKIISPSFSTETTLTPGVVVPRIFHDVIVKNIDTRLLRNDDGNTVLLYAFPNASTLIITTDEGTFFEVFRRLTTSK